jgi:hypothetical protein
MAANVLRKGISSELVSVFVMAIGTTYLISAIFQVFKKK